MDKIPDSMYLGDVVNLSLPVPQFNARITEHYGWGKLIRDNYFDFYLRSTILAPKDMKVTADRIPAVATTEDDITFRLMAPPKKGLYKWVLTYEYIPYTYEKLNKAVVTAVAGENNSEWVPTGLTMPASQQDIPDEEEIEYWDFYISPKHTLSLIHT